MPQNSTSEKDDDFEPWMAMKPVKTKVSVAHFQYPDRLVGELVALTPYGHHQAFPARVLSVKRAQAYVDVSIPFPLYHTVLTYGGTVAPHSIILPKPFKSSPSHPSNFLSVLSHKCCDFWARLLQFGCSFIKSKSSGVNKAQQ
jgi:hypothetical protein